MAEYASAPRALCLPARERRWRFPCVAPCAPAPCSVDTERILQRSAAAARGTGKDSTPPAILQQEESGYESKPRAERDSATFPAAPAGARREYSNPDSAACCKSRGESFAGQRCR